MSDELLEKKGVLPLGILGAVMGAILGSVIWILVGMLGFIAGIAGYAIIIFALKGYEIIGRGIDKKGKIISVIIALLMIAFANYAYYIIDTYQALTEIIDIEMSVFIKNFPEMMTQADAWGDFVKDLAIGYGLSIWASFNVLKDIFKPEQKNENKVINTNEFNQYNYNQVDYNDTEKKIEFEQE